MDLMEVRRNMMGVIAQMAKGAEVIKGTFTTPSSGTSYTLEFGKSFNRYFYLIEMTNETKTALIQSGVNANQCFAVHGLYPVPKVNNNSVSDNSYFSSRINPSTSAIVGTVATSTGTDDSSIKMNVADFGGAANALYKSCTYDYIVVSLDNI